MSNQDFGRGPVGGAGSYAGASEWRTKTAQSDQSGASSIVEGAAEKLKEAASSTAASLAGEAKQLLDRQVDTGADKLGCVARSARVAAAELDRDSPAIAALIRTLASRLDGYADQLRGQSVDQIWQSAADLTRRQPALVFGLAALAGFVALRTVKASPPITSPSIQPYRAGQGGVSYGS